MSNNKQLVVICMATFNGEAYLTQQLESLLCQTYTDWVLQVHDDGSTDSTNEILERYRCLYPEKIIIMNDSKSFGSAKDNFFHILKNCSGDYIFLCDQDDVWMPDKIKLTLKVFKSLESKLDPSGPLLVHSDLEVVDKNMNTTIPSMNAYLNNRKQRVEKSSLIFSNPITGCTVCVNRALVDLVQNYEKAIMHDWFLGLLCLYRHGKVFYLDKTLIKYRQHGSNTEGIRKVNILQKLFQSILHLPRFIETTKKIYSQAIIFEHQSYQKFFFKRIFHAFGFFR